MGGLEVETLVTGPQGGQGQLLAEVVGSCTPSGGGWPERRRRRQWRLGPFHPVWFKPSPASQTRGRPCRTWVTDQGGSLRFARRAGGGWLSWGGGRTASKLSWEGVGQRPALRIVTHPSEQGCPPQPRPRWW